MCLEFKELGFLGLPTCMMSLREPALLVWPLSCVPWIVEVSLPCLVKCELSLPTASLNIDMFSSDQADLGAMQLLAG